MYSVGLVESFKIICNISLHCSKGCKSVIRTFNPLQRGERERGSGKVRGV